MANDEDKVGDAVPAAQRSSWSTFLKSIASFSGDLSSLTAPPFILSPVSLTEFPAYWCEHPELFADIAGGHTDEERAVLVLKWFISTLKGQYTSRNESMGSEKKPLNPVLGELFYGYWPDKDGGRTNLVVEQVSHHPPITGYYIENASKGIRLNGHSGQKTSFSGGSIIVKQVGHAILTVTLPSGDEEKYLITLPRLRIDGLWYGSPYIELTEHSSIQSSTGWLSHIEYKGRGYFSGLPARFHAVLSHPEAKEQHIYDGQWTGLSHAKDKTPFADCAIPKEEVTVAPVSEQGQLESRRLWQHVSRGIRSGDFDLASREKSRIENEQRQMRKDERAAGTTWELRHFERIEHDADYERLGKLFNVVPPTEEAFIFKPSSISN